jgi:hypothetical protein
VVEAAPADEGAAEFEQGFVDVVADLLPDPQAVEPVQQCEALLDDPAQLAQPGTVFSAAAGDHRRDAELADQGAVLVVVVAAVGVDLRRLPAWPSAFAADRRDRLQR